MCLGLFLILKGEKILEGKLSELKAVDEVKIRTGFLRGIIGKIIEKIIRDKIGRDMKFSLKDLDIEIGEMAELRLEVAVKMSKDDLYGLIKDKIGL